MAPSREVTLRREILAHHRKLVALYAELRALGVEDASTSIAWQLTNYLAVTPGEHTPSAIARVLGIDSRITRALLSPLALEGKIARPKMGHYTASTKIPAKSVVRPRRTRPVDEALAARLEPVLKREKAPLSVRQVLTRLRLGADERDNVTRTLNALAMNGRIRRVRKGVFAAKVPRREPLIDILEHLLSRTKGELSSAQIIATLKFPRVKSRSVGALLSLLVQQGRIRRVNRGVYAALTVPSPRRAEPPPADPTPTREALSGKRRTPEVGPSRRARMTSPAALVPKPNAPRSRPTPTPLTDSDSLDEALFRALKSHHGGVALDTVAATLDGDLDELDKALRTLLASKRVRRLRQGVYVALA